MISFWLSYFWLLQFNLPLFIDSGFKNSFHPKSNLAKNSVIFSWDQKSMKSANMCVCFPHDIETYFRSGRIWSSKWLTRLLFSWSEIFRSEFMSLVDSYECGCLKTNHTKYLKLFIDHRWVWSVSGKQEHIGRGSQVSDSLGKGFWQLWSWISDFEERCWAYIWTGFGVGCRGVILTTAKRKSVDTLMW